jgi:hypothetical protein
MNPVLQQIDDWLLAHRAVETDHGGDGHRYIEFKVDRHNRFDNVLFALNDDTTLAWYGEPFISGEDIAASPHGEKLDAYLLRDNERLPLGRWSRTVTGALLFDVSVPIKGAAPPSWLLSQIYDVTCDGFDLMISRVRLLLEHGLALEKPNRKDYTECLNFAADDPSVLPHLEALGLLKGEAVTAIHKFMNMPTTPWSQSLQEQTREAVDEMRVAPDGLMHFKHKTLGYATICFDNICASRFLLRPKKDGTEHEFADVDGLLAGGWVVD